jgi:hypothetical protein
LQLNRAHQGVALKDQEAIRGNVNSVSDHLDTSITLLDTQHCENVPKRFKPPSGVRVLLELFEKKCLIKSLILSSTGDVVQLRYRLVPLFETVSNSNLNLLIKFVFIVGVS